MERSSPTYFVPSVDLAARILQLLSRYRTTRSTLTEIANATGDSKTTCLRVVKTLQGHGLVRYDADTHRYSLGLTAVVIGARAEEALDYVSYVRPCLTEASDRTNLTAVLIQRVTDDRLMYVAKQESLSRARVNISVGNRFPITEVSYGKWLLAYASPDEREKVLAAGLRQVTPATLTDVSAYRDQLNQIRDEGVLISVEEYVPGVCAVSAPILKSPTDLLGVMAVLGLASSQTNYATEEIAAIVKEIAAQCSQTLQMADHLVLSCLILAGCMASGNVVNWARGSGRRQPAQRYEQFEVRARFNQGQKLISGVQVGESALTPGPRELRRHLVHRHAIAVDRARGVVQPPGVMSEELLNAAMEAFCYITVAREQGHIRQFLDEPQRVQVFTER
jgi:IclR family KDG regulon transcriptional repressor